MTLCPAGWGAAPSGETQAVQPAISMSAERIYREGFRVQDVWWEPGEPGIHLARRIVVQNDSPGCGRRDDDAGVFEEIPEGAVLSKELEISDPVPAHAELAFVGRERVENTAVLEFEVNGARIERRPTRLWAPGAKQYAFPDPATGGVWGWSRWQYQEIPGAYLRTGKNRILIRSRGRIPGWSIMVADYADFHKGCAATPQFPKTSARSEDGGKTWRRDNLGSQKRIAGEYVLRLILDSYRPSGFLSSRVMDGAGEDAATFRGARQVLDVQVKTASRKPPETDLLTEVRSGDTPVYDAGRWSAWQTPGADGRIAQVRGRYLQWRVKFSTARAEATPELDGIAIAARLAPESANFGAVKIVREENFQLGPAPEGCRYEDYRGSYLQKFRESYKLDAVVAGTRDEWERQRRLMKWAYHAPLKPAKQRGIFPWDPQNWLEARRLADGSLASNTYSVRRRDAMCLFPNATLVAALLSFGYPARHINLDSEGISGHEIAEVWSGEFGKWVFLDATLDLYWKDKKTGIPVNTLEIHKALADRLQKVETWRHPFYYEQKPETYLKDLPIAAVGGEEPVPVSDTDRDFIVTTASYLRMIPRGDVFSRAEPLPVSQGQEMWCWDGYLNWADAKTPPLDQFSHHTNRESDFNWPLNQVRYVAEATATPGVVSVTLEHDMPNCAALLARFGDGPWRPVENRFPWKLHAGRNTLAVRGRNTLGVEGPASTLILDYRP